VRDALQLFDVIHTLDRPIAAALAEKRSAPESTRACSCR
jgi:hypothetical protein